MDSHSKLKTKQTTTKNYYSDDSADIPLQKKRRTAVPTTESDDDVPLRKVIRKTAVGSTKANKAVDKALVTKKELEASQATAALAIQESDRIDALLKSVATKYGPAQTHTGVKAADDQGDEDAAESGQESSYRKSHEKLRQGLVDLREQVKVMSEHAYDCTDLTVMVLGALDNTYRIKRLSIDEFERPDFEYLLSQLLAAPASQDLSGMVSWLRVAVFIDAGILANKLRLGLMSLAEHVDGKTYEASLSMPPPTFAEDGASAGLGRSESKVTEIYQGLLETFATLLAEIRPALALLEDQFEEEPDAILLDQNIDEWTKRSTYIQEIMGAAKGRIEQIVHKKPQEIDHEQVREKWRRVRRTLGGLFARAVIAAYARLEEAYEYVRNTAEEFAPATFEHLRP
ncbi:hypothetical protein LTR17_023856 [Elasticomyces elasticus]|nr:hypothetical protein LTR17_023856 [Elasticomyces elasticus]